MSPFSLPNKRTMQSSSRSTPDRTPRETNEEFPLEDISYEEIFPVTVRTQEDPENSGDVLFYKVLQAACTNDWISHGSSMDQRELSSLQNVINKLDPYRGSAPLHYAAMKGHHYVVNLLLENGADVNIWDRNFKVTPLQCAAAYGHKNVIKQLLKKGAEVNAGLESSCASTALLWATRKGHADIVRYLLKKYHASQNSTLIYSETPVHAAVIGGFPNILETLIEFNGSTEFSMGIEKNTPLHLAASGDYPHPHECCKILLEKGYAPVNSENYKGQTPLHHAATFSDPEVLSLLISQGASVDSEDCDGKTPIFYLVSDDPDALKSLEVLILEGKCDVNHRDKEGHTALHFAAFKAAAGAVEILLRNEADFSIKTNEGGVSALSLLLRKIPNTPNIVSQLLDSAVTVSRSETGKGKYQETKVKVKYNFVLPASPQHTKPPSRNPARKSLRKPFQSHFSTPSDTKGHAKIDISETTKEHDRKETAKLKCLIDEKQDKLLLHPVVHSFISLKWAKAKPIFISIWIFKLVLALVFSLYAQLPFIATSYFFLNPESNMSASIGESRVLPTTESYSNSGAAWLRPPEFPGTTTPKFQTENKIQENLTSESKERVVHLPLWFSMTYGVILLFVLINTILELPQFVRTPKSYILTFESWSFAAVLVIMLFLNPVTWGLWGPTGDLIDRSIAATGVVLSWIHVWFYMGHFPDFGLSIRVFFKVVQDFFIFLLPHFCLFTGFILAFTLLFPENREFRNLLLAVPRAIRIMAGDNDSPTEEEFKQIKYNLSGSDEEPFAYFLTTYIYTAYVLTVGIVLMNLLIGLAVHDIQGIYAEASKHRLMKETILLNTLESNFTAKWIRRFVPRQFIKKYINLFSSSQSKTVTFKPYDPRDTKLRRSLKKALVELDSPSGQQAGKEKESSAKPCLGVEEGILRLEQKIDELIRKLSLVLETP